MVDRWVSTVVLVVWLINGLMAIASIYVISNWSAFVWIVGSAGWAVVFEIFVVLSLLYMFMIGCCILGWESHMQNWYRATTSKSLRCMALYTPTLIAVLFLSLAVVALASTQVSDRYVHAHAGEVFRRSDTNNDHFLDYYEYSRYTLSLHQFMASNTSDFRRQLTLVFDTLDEDSDGYVSAAEFDDGVSAALAPARHAFGISVFVVAACVLALVAIFWLWKARLKAHQYELANRNDPFFDS